MRAAPLLLALLAALILAAGAWYLGGSSPVEPRDGAGPAPLGLSPEAPSGAVELAPASAPEADAPGDGARVQVEASPSDDAPEGADATARGPRRVAGRVVDELGRPVQGARVLVGRQDPFGLPVDLRRAGPSGDREAEVLTGEDGRFELVSGLRGDVQLAVRASGFAPLRAARTLEGGELAEVEDLVLARGVILEGFVVDAAGRGVPDVGIEPREASAGGLVVTFAGPVSDPSFRTGPDGSFRVDELSAGPFELVLQHAEHPTEVVEGTAPRVGETVAGLRYVLEDGREIAGVVRGLEPGASGTLRVRARPGRGDSFDPGAMLRTRSADLAADGSFLLGGLGEGLHTLHVVDAAEDLPWSSPRSAPVVAEAGERDVELVLTGGRGLRFRVVDDRTGEPLEDFTVELGGGWLEPLRAEGGGTREHHPGGLVEVPDVRVEPGRSVARVRIESERHARLDLDEVRLAPGEVTDLGDLRLVRVPELRVRVVDDATGEPLEGARVRVTEAPRPSVPGGAVRIGIASADLEVGEAELGDWGGLPGGESRSAKTGADGVALLGSLPGRRVRVVVTARRHADLRLDDLVLPAGDHALEARMTRGGTVRVTVLDADGEPLARARVRQQLEGAERAHDVGTTNAAGVATFRNLAAGTHRFRLLEEAGGGMMFEFGGGVEFGAGNSLAQDGEAVKVAEGGESELVLRAPARGSVTGTVTENGQPLAGARVAFEAAGGDDGGEAGFLMLMGGGRSATTDARGRYTLEGLTPGAHRARISHATRSMDAVFELDLAAGENAEDFALTVAVLEGRVTDSEGRPAPGVEVRVERAGGDERAPQVMMMSVVSDAGGAVTVSSGGESPRAVRTDADGRYALRGVEPHSPLVVRTRAGTYQEAASEEVLVADGQTRRGVDLSVFEAGRVRARVVDAAGEPVGFCLVHLEWSGDADESVEARREFVGEGGEVVLEGLRPGAWTARAERLDVQASPGAPPEERPRSEPAPVAVSPGEASEVTLRIEG